MKLTWLGHAAWLVESDEKRVLIDPFITGNPSAPVKAADLKDIDLVFVTHNHSDHLGDAIEISNRNNAKVVSVFENVIAMQSSGLKASNGVGMNKGGELIDIGGIRAALVQAVHSGNECGVVFEMEGKTVYHAGDTAFFSDMSLIKRFFKPDVAMLPIGGYFTMSLDQAVEAAKLIGAKTTLPMHYNTFPQIRQDPEEFKRRLSGVTNVVVLKPGEVTSINQ